MIFSVRPEMHVPARVCMCMGQVYAIISTYITVLIDPYACTYVCM